MGAANNTYQIPIERVLEGQRGVLESIAQGASLGQVLTSIAKYSEMCTPTMLASILQLETSTGRLRRAGHGKVPDSFAEAVDGLLTGPARGAAEPPRGGESA